ncbi:MAG: hypothetical protein FRX48_00022 [Lasallia pustulata]|uniref:BZIP transcription factor n=1 Tax=Lasallia pustulata TaxID=136370 RepID=A0A5M8Q1P6_9LECA|nr:MAG: hypothetical protein FRX48_00022 [Lasallia pustulata]
MATTTPSQPTSSDTIPLPSIADPLPRPTPDSTPSSTVSSDNEHARMGRASLPSRPKLSSRHASSTNIVPLTHPSVETRHEAYPPDDARAMSPRRSSEETAKIGQETRVAVQEHARVLQSGLSALAERIETVKADHDKLEKQNVALQDYIGGLTRSMSSTSIKAKK